MTWSKLKLFKNWFTITNTNNMRQEKISKIDSLMFYACGLAAWLSENCANICDTVSGRNVNTFQFPTSVISSLLHSLNHENYHSLTLVQFQEQFSDKGSSIVLLAPL